MGFGATTTADEVIEGVDLSGRLALVTGGGAGLGAETGRALARAGAAIVLGGRDPTRGERARDLIRTAVPTAAVEILHLDLASLSSVRAAASEFLRRHEQLQLLVNNAGVMAIPFERSVDGFELQFATNHLGHFLLTNLLVPALVAGAPSRIVNVTSSAHLIGEPDLDDPNYEHREYEKWRAYGESKSANILFTVELERRLGGRGVHAFAVHPGLIFTDLYRYLPPDELEAAARRGVERTGTPAKGTESGAATSVYAATAPELDAHGGAYLADCNVSDAAAAWAIDPVGALKLWQISERLVGETFPG
jgi:NAD(P)-dependent dehydrogenase (short-subunit alcohol dehydrogenase family)